MLSGEKVVWDDLILTNRERGIETFGSLEYEKLLTETIENQRIQLNKGECYIIDRLNIRKLAKFCFLLPVVTDCVEEHTYFSLYLEENDDLDWNQLFFTLKANLKNYQNELQKQIDDPDYENVKGSLQLNMIEGF